MNGKEYLSFTKRERTGILTLIVILLMVIFLPKYFYREDPSAPVLSEQDVEKLTSEPAERKAYQHYEKRDSIFRTYTNHFNRENDRRPGYGNYFKKKFAYTADKHNSYYDDKRPLRKKIVIDVNAADTSAFIALPFIGSKLAARIILFREKLGGFYDVQQIKEVYGITDSVFSIILPQLKCDTSLVRKIDINTAGKDALKTHPYIRWNIANALIAYRDNHGVFSSFDDLAKVNNVDVETLRKLMPYLFFR